MQRECTQVLRLSVIGQRETLPWSMHWAMGAVSCGEGGEGGLMQGLARVSRFTQR